ncbi:MAG: sigma-54 dependent transcriptional regulator [Alphaproteobacteria bacterium]|uniref:Sigma-54 dependent transcriptional regulator n=1 Tax=Candidatus Nitrobium versatile TaxID=2884831 RepID=A0A953J4K3_9BACT|nr:sigma-54 dependent transcriptional regulator [Candidatus Nitrobium versatile]
MNDTGNGRVLIIDDDPNARRVLSAILSDSGYRVFEAKEVDEAVSVITAEDVDTVITDLKMPGRDGMQLFNYISDTHPDIPVIFLTAYGTVESAVTTITHGAFYYFIKPPDYVKLKSILSRAVEQRRLKRELENLRRKLSSESSPLRIISNTPAMISIIETIEAVRDSSSSVLITGETGTGKELIARSLHYSSTRGDSPFIAVNCAAIPKELIESELFGYERGAFTGAVTRRIGRFEEAADGSVFLDEIGELELSLQAKLLRALQEKEIERLGSNRKMKVDFRLISSTNRDLRKEVAEGTFREDLFYRINVVHINVPPLRERKDDIPLLVAEFLNEFCIREKKVISVADEVMRIFLEYPWPGNIRQLKNVIERAVVLVKGNKITPRELPDEFRTRRNREFFSPPRTLKQLEVHAVRETLSRCNGNKSKAARMLGISRKAFYKKLRDFQLQ